MIITRVPETIGFFPKSIPTSWTGIEVHPVATDETEVFRCDPKEAEFWSIYLIGQDGLSSCIADVPTKELAERLAGLIEGAIVNRQPDRTELINEVVQCNELLSDTEKLLDRAFDIYHNLTEDGEPNAKIGEIVKFWQDMTELKQRIKESKK